MRAPGSDSCGFTLVEVIITIIVSSILAVLMMQVMRGHISRSYWALEKIDDGLVLQEVMEIINANYRRLLTEDPQPLVTLQNEIDNNGNPSTYWAAAYGGAITVDSNTCLELGQDPVGEFNHRDCQHPRDTLLKVTLSYNDHRLTTLFGR